MLAAGTLVALLYTAFVLLTCRAPYTGAEWGPQWLSVALEVAVRQILKVLGISSKVVFDSGAPPTAPLQRIGCCAPHGAFPVTCICIAMFRFRNDPVLRHFRLRSAGATVLFWLPVVREMLLLLGVRDASRPNLQRLLREGYSVAICPGGIWEQVNTSEFEEKHYCQRGLGFLRLAMEAGVPLLPLYTFGENQVYRTHTPLLELRLWIARRLRVGLPLITGAHRPCLEAHRPPARWLAAAALSTRGGLGLAAKMHASPLSSTSGSLYLPGVPLPAYTEHVVGRQIDVGPPNAAPTDAQVGEVFGRYEAELDRLFRAHAPRLLPPQVAAKGLRLEWLGHRTKVLGLPK